MLTPIFFALSFVQLKLLATHYNRRSYTITRLAYLSFSSDTDMPVTKEILYQYHSRKGQYSIEFVSSIYSAINRGDNTSKGRVNGKFVRFAVNFEDGLEIVVDRDGNLSYAGCSFQLSRSSYAALIELLAIRFRQNP